MGISLDTAAHLFACPGTVSLPASRVFSSCCHSYLLHFVSLNSTARRVPYKLTTTSDSAVQGLARRKHSHTFTYIRGASSMGSRIPPWLPEMYLSSWEHLTDTNVASGWAHTCSQDMVTAVYYRALRTSSAHCSGFNSSSPMVCSLSSQPFSSPYLLRISFLTGFLEGPQIPAKCSCEHTNMLPFSLVTNSKAVWFNSSDKRSTLSSMVGDCISYRSAYRSNRYWAAVPCL